MMADTVKYVSIIITFSAFYVAKIGVTCPISRYKLRFFSFFRIHPRRFLMQLSDFIGEPLGFEHLEPRASREQLPLEVGCGSEEKLEVGKILFVSDWDFLLRVVQGQVSEVKTLFAVGTEHDAHGLAAVADDHAVALAEELASVEVLVHLEGLVGGCQVFHAVEGEHGEAAVIEATQQIPSLAEQLDAIRREDKAAGFGGLVAFVTHQHLASRLHRADDEFEVFAVGGDVFEHDAVLHAQALTDDVVDGECGEHPVLDRVLAQHFLIADEVAVAIAPVAVDEDAEYVLDGVLVAVEGGAAQRHAFAHLGALPPLIDFGQSNPFGSADGVHQPDVLLEEGWDGHDGIGKLQI